MSYQEIILLLFIINLGTAFGAGLYETKIILPLWFNKSPQGKYSANFENMRSIDTGRKFWGLITTLPLTLLTIINLISAFRSQQPLHDWWLAAGLIVLFERIGTFAFFIPTAIKLQKGDQLPADKISGMISSWITLNYLRNTLTFVAWCLSLKALTLL